MLLRTHKFTRRDGSVVLLALVLSAALLGIGGVPSTMGSTFTVGRLVRVSGPSPFTASTSTTIGCNGALQTGTNYKNAEVEPYVAVNPTDATNIVGVWQQDRWSNGGANALGTGFSSNGGKTWGITFPPFSACAGGVTERASDPWVSFGPSGTAYQVAIAFNKSNPVSLVLASKSTDGGQTWSPPATLKSDDLATVLNDKESITADPVAPENVYVVWDRLVFPTEQARGEAFENAVGFHGPAWFTRSTDGGNTWEPARIILDPGELNQTIGNQIVVLPPSGVLIDGFNLIFSAANVGGERGFNVAVMQSVDKGLNWSAPIIVNKLLSIPVTDPNTGQAIRTGDILPSFAVNSAGTIYAVWQDARFSGFVHDDIAFSQSVDGGVTWSAPVMINKTPNPNGLGLSNISAFTASVSVAGDGTIAVTYYDFRGDAAGNTSTLPTDYWIVHCPLGLSCTNPDNWTEDHVAGPFDMKTAPVARGFFVGDYEGLTSSGNTFRLFFVKTNTPCDGQVCSPVDLTNRTDVFTTTAGP